MGDPTVRGTDAREESPTSPTSIPAGVEPMEVLGPSLAHLSCLFGLVNSGSYGGGQMDTPATSIALYSPWIAATTNRLPVLTYMYPHRHERANSRPSVTAIARRSAVR